MAITTQDDIVAGLASAQDIYISKSTGTPKATGNFQSAWLGSGGRPGVGAVPPAYTAGAGYTCDRTTVGAVPLQNAAIQNWLARAGLGSTQPGVLIIADRLWSCSGMGFAAGTYTVTTPGNLPARITDNGVDVEAWVENFVAAGAATGTLTLNYLNANSGAAQSGVISSVISSPVLGQMQPIPLATGDTGVRQITSVTTSATWTSGNFGITLLRRLVEIPFPAIGLGPAMDWATLGLPKIPNDACLMLLWLANGTSSATIVGSLSLIDK